MPESARAVGLAAVRDGWTGFVRVTVGAVVAVARPAPRTSVAAFWAEVGRAAARVHGGAWRTFGNDAGRVVIEAPVVFSLVLGGTARTRSGWTSASYSGAATYTADVAHEDGVYFDGAGLSGLAAGDWQRGAPFATGVDSIVQVAHGTRGRGTGELFVDLPMGQAAVFAVADGPAQDLWFDGRLLARVKVGAARVGVLALGGASTRCRVTFRLEEAT